MDYFYYFISEKKKKYDFHFPFYDNFKTDSGNVNCNFSNQKKINDKPIFPSIVIVKMYI